MTDHQPPSPWAPPQPGPPPPPHDPWASPGTPPTAPAPPAPSTAPPAPPYPPYPPTAAPGYGYPPADHVGPGTAAPGATDDFWPTDPGWMDFDPDRPPPRWGIPDIVLGILAFVLGGVVVALPLAFLVDSTAAVAIAGLAGSWAGALGYLLLISRTKGQGSFRRDFGFAFTWWDPLIGVGVGFATMIAAAIVALAIAAAFGEPRTSNAEDIFGPVADNRPLFVVMALMASFGAPVVEELLFRGLALRALERRLGGIVAVIGSSVLFSVLHLQGGTLAAGVGLVAVIGIYGIVLAVLTRWSNRLGPAICTHLFINGLQCLILLVTVFSGRDLNF